MEDKAEIEKQKPLKILMFGEEKGLNDLVGDKLEIPITAFTRAEDALAELRKRKEEGSYFDWVVIDCDWVGKDPRLEGRVDGFELAQKIKAEQLGNPYVTMLTGNPYSQNIDPEELAEKGIHNWVDKLKLNDVRNLVETVRQFRAQSENPQS